MDEATAAQRKQVPVPWSHGNFFWNELMTREVEQLTEYLAKA